MVNAYDYEYHVATEITEDRRYNFGACLLAAIGQADDINRAILKSAFPVAYEAFMKNQQIGARSNVADWIESKKGKAHREHDD